MTRGITLVVTCTKQKTRPVREELHLRYVLGNTIEERADRWTDRLQHCDGDPVPVERLYSGDHWSHSQTR